MATAALVGVSLFFLTQLRFELQSTTTSEFILTEFGIDRAEPEIRQWVYNPDSAIERPSAEVGASRWLAGHHLQAFSEDREKITHDMVLFSLAYFLQTPEAQYWDVQRHSLVGKHSGGVIRFHPSPKRQCTIVMPSDIKSNLERAGNVFAGSAAEFVRSVCLPPSSTFQITANSLIIRNHVCEVSFTIEPSRGVDFLSPLRGEEFQKLPNGESRFETRTTGLDVKIRFFALRIGQRDGDKYRQWSSALVSGARDWFEK